MFSTTKSHENALIFTSLTVYPEEGILASGVLYLKLVPNTMEYFSIVHIRYLNGSMSNKMSYVCTIMLRVSL